MISLPRLYPSKHSYIFVKRWTSIRHKSFYTRSKTNSPIFPSQNVSKLRNQTQIKTKPYQQNNKRVFQRELTLSTFFFISQTLNLETRSLCNGCLNSKHVSMADTQWWLSSSVESLSPNPNKEGATANQTLSFKCDLWSRWSSLFLLPVEIGKCDL